MNIPQLHDRANEAIEALDVALARTVESGSEGELLARPATVKPLPDVDYGTREGCDKALVAVGRRIQEIENLDEESVAEAGEEALTACRELAAAIKEQRADLGIAGAVDGN